MRDGAQTNAMELHRFQDDLHYLVVGGSASTGSASLDEQTISKPVGTSHECPRLEIATAFSGSGMRI
jgi:hypothetical protein